eukprot:TRINITY_DN2987_c0_g2_i5.p1 TRINITY_DN2987_c0_g2~~TRINITY_DN2987_c0_g2_i5.p1  ORF type:complete len:302 (-),score=55.44 TRINITY_DN2987_c0_g2_i5:572-1477(-)
MDDMDENIDKNHHPQKNLFSNQSQPDIIAEKLHQFSDSQLPNLKQQQDDQQLRQHRGETVGILEDSIQLESKVFFFDLNLNQWGRYLKIAEKAKDKPRSALIFASDSIPELYQIIEFYCTEEGQKNFNKRQIDLGGKNITVEYGDNKSGKFLVIQERSEDRFRVGRSFCIPMDHRNVNIQLFRQTLYKFYLKESQLTGKKAPEFKQMDSQQNQMENSNVDNNVDEFCEPVVTKVDNQITVALGWKQFEIKKVENVRGECIRVRESSGDRSSLVIIPLEAAKFVGEAISEFSQQLENKDKED